MHRTLSPLPRRGWTWLACMAVFACYCLKCKAADSSGPDKFSVRSWTSESGLTAGDINALARTSDGFLWVATDTGLLRFDGARFELMDERQLPVLPGEQVSCLLADQRGTLWAGTSRGHLFERSRGKSQFQYASPDAQLDVGAIIDLAEGGDGTLWAATTRSGVICYRQGKWHARGSPEELPSRRVDQVLVDQRGQVWAVSKRQLMRWEETQGRFSKTEVPKSLLVSKLAADQDGSLWVATTATLTWGTRVFHLKEGQWNEPQESYPWQQTSMHSIPTSLTTDRSGRLWVCTAGDGVLFSHDGRDWQYLSREGSLAHDGVNALLHDQEGTVWIGMRGGQLFQARKRVVTTLKPEGSDARNVLQSVCVRRDGSVWCGTYGSGVFCYHDGQWRHYEADAGLANSYTFTVFEDAQTNLWVGTRRGLFKLEDNRFKLAPFMPGFVLALFEDREGALWISTHRGLTRRQGRTLTEFGRNEGLQSGPDIRTIAEDPDGAIWAAVVNIGLFKKVGERFEPFTPGNLPRAMDVRAMHFDADGTLWLATFGRGLYRVKDDEVRNWTVQDGLPSNYLVSLVNDSAGDLWLGTINGIFGLSRKTLHDYVPGESPPLLGRHLSVAEGLDSQICSGWGQPVATRGPDGRLWFPNQRALIAFDPTAAHAPTQKLTVTVEDLLVDGVQVPFARNSAARVLSGARRFEFHYTLPELVAPARVRFRYRLQGLENDWVEAQQQRSASYNHLRPGRYQFQVMASCSDGVWREAQFPVVLEVVPRIWERTSVRTAGAAAGLGTMATIVWMVGRARMRRRLWRLEAQQATEQERRRIARDLHDELGSGLTEIMQLGDQGCEEDIPLDALQGNARNIAAKTRQVATALDEIVWTTNPKNDTLLKFIGYLCDYAQEFIGATAIHCRLDVAPPSEDRQLNAVLRHNLFLACKEALNNAVRHSGATEVWIRIRHNQDQLLIIIEDNGQGFLSNNPPEGSPAHGNGLQNMRERIDLSGGKLSVLSQPGKGTSVTFELNLAATK